MKKEARIEPSALRRVQFIKHAQGLGLSLDEIRKLCYIPGVHDREDLGFVVTLTNGWLRADLVGVRELLVKLS